MKLPLFILASAFVVVRATLPDQVTQNDVQQSALRGKKIYEEYCLSCHQADGSGVPKLNPPLKKTTYVLGQPEPLIKIILKGLDEEIEINGEYYSNPMPSFGGVLSDQQVADVLTYVRNSFGNKASAITAAKVKAVREKK
jgi:mono/diheme cytochrome c family protein